MTTATLKTKPAARVSRAAAPACPAEALLREWVKLVSKSAKSKTDADRTRVQEIQHDKISQVIARSDVGAAFQLLVAATSWPWRPQDETDSCGKVSDEAMESLTDGMDYRSRLILGAYFHMTRTFADVDLRAAEMFLTGGHSSRGLMGWMQDAQSVLTFRDVL
jgi:hypothetical protein